jgi:hypothetical protein
MGWGRAACGSCWSAPRAHTHRRPTPPRGGLGAGEMSARPRVARAVASAALGGQRGPAPQANGPAPWSATWNAVFAPRGFLNCHLATELRSRDLSRSQCTPKLCLSSAEASCSLLRWPRQPSRRRRGRTPRRSRACSTTHVPSARPPTGGGGKCTRRVLPPFSWCCRTGCCPAAEQRRVKPVGGTAAQNPLPPRHPAARRARTVVRRARRRRADGLPGLVPKLGHRGPAVAALRRCAAPHHPRRFAAAGRKPRAPSG